MPKLPGPEELGQRPTPTPPGGIAQYNGSIPGEEKLGRSQMALGNTISQAGELLWHEKEKIDTTRIEDAWNQYKNAAMDLTIGDKGVLKQKGGNAVNGNLLQTTGVGLAQARQQIELTLTDDIQKERFAARAATTDLQVKHQVMMHIDQEQREYAKTTIMGSEAAAKSQIAAMPTSPDVFQGAKDTLMAQADTYLNLQGVTDNAARAAYKDKIGDSLWSTRIDALLYSQPLLADSMFRANEKEIKSPELRLNLQNKTREVALSVNAGIEAQKVVDEARQQLSKPDAIQRPPGSVEVGFNGAVESLLKREGGYASKDGKSGAPVNFGINQKANPDIDVKNLTRQGAIEIYRKRYWDAIGGDSLPPATALVALDAAALQGVEVAKKLIMDADGDPQTMIDLRRQQLTALAEKDPAQKPFLAQWLKRLDGLQAEAATTQKVGFTADDPTAQNTSGLPNSRDIAAMLPMMVGKVEKRASELYGPDIANPDRAAFVKRMTAEVHSKVAADVQQLNAIQRQAQGTLIDAVTGITPVGAGEGNMPIGAGGARAGAPGMMLTSFSQIQADPKLMRAWQLMDPQAKVGIERLMEHNMRANDVGDVRLYRDLFNRIHLEPGDPNKIDFYKQIVDPKVADRLSMPQINALRTEIDRQETPGGRSLTQMRKAADANVATYFKTNVMFTAQPDRQIAATMQWNEDTGRKIDDYVKAGQPEKVRLMFQMNTPESVIKPEYLQTYVNSTPAQGVAQGAAAVKQGAQAPLATPPAQPKTEAEYNALPPGAVYLDPTGKQRQKPGQAPAAPGYGARADGTQKGTGYFGELPATGGKVSTEISVGVNIGGKEMEIPTLVPTLTRPEIDHLLAGQAPTKEIVDKAVAFAKTRIAAGKDPFAGPNEQVTPPAAMPTMNEQGKLVQPPPQATTPAAITADAFEITEKPTTVAGNLAAIRKARERALEIRRFGAQGPQYDVTGPLESIAAGFGAVEDQAKAIGRKVGEVPKAVGAAIAQKIPTEMEAVLAGFEAIKKNRRVTVADQDILTEALKYGQLPPDDEKLARDLLVRLQGKK